MREPPSEFDNLPEMSGAHVAGDVREAHDAGQPVTPHRRRRATGVPWVLRVYRLAMWAYPSAFRRRYGDEMWRVARDADAEARMAGDVVVVALWLRIAADLAHNASAERISLMRPTVVLAAVMTGVAGVIAVLASLNLYLLEDGNPLTSAAYRASSLLGASYDVAYLSALVAGVGVCAIVVYAVVGPSRAATVSLGTLAVFVAFAGFGGLLVRAPLTFAALGFGFACLTLASFFVGRRVATRLRRRSGARAAVIGACVGCGGALLVNTVALTLHTLALNPISHPLYMQGQIPGTHLNALLIGLALALLTLALYALSLLAALRPRA